MGIRTHVISRSSLVFCLLVLMIPGLLVSRALLSMSMIAFLVITIGGSDIRRLFRSWYSNPALIGMTLLFIVPLVSGLWSDDKKEWSEMMLIKLPLLLMPFAFAGNWQLSEPQWRNLSYLFVALTFAGCCWSLVQYLQHQSELHEGYLRAKVIPTPLENDHVRFSLMVCIAVISSVALLIQKPKVARAALVGVSLFFVAYLHILSARTGLLGFYIFLVLLIIHLLRSSRDGRAWWLLVALIALPVLAWIALPTFRHRIQYNRYDLSFILKKQYLPGANDGNRALSIRAGWEILKAHPGGVGTGDLKKQTREWYAAEMPQMLETDKLYPSSEWLVYGGSAGWAGVAVFTIAMLLPFFQKMRRGGLIWISLNIIAASSFLFDIGLEVQFGVFLYAFVVLWWWKWLHKANSPAEKL